MKLKILSLNLFRYYDEWERRKPLIANYIREQNPDIVMFQECFDDGRHNGPDENQASQINKELRFKQCIYHIAEMLRTERKMLLTTSVFDGLGFLSNHPIIESCAIRLKQHEEDGHFRIIQRIVLTIQGNKIILFHTHFSNHDSWARWQLEETLEYAKKEEKLPIIGGDLNIKITDDIMQLTKDSYLNSWAEKEYTSYPAKNEVLDYVLIPKKMSFVNIICDKDGLSDHRPLVVEIEVPHA